MIFPQDPLGVTQAACAVRRSAGALRDREEEPAPRAERALDPDPAAVELHELARDREPEPRPVVLARRRRVHLRELAEDEVVVLGGDPDPGVPDLDDELAGDLGRGPVRVPEPGGDPDAPSLGGEVDPVPDEVPERLVQALLER